MMRPALIAVIALLALPAHAQTPAATAGFLIMDTDRLATESTAMRSIFEQMSKRRDIEAAAYNMALDKLEKEFEPIRQAKDTIDPAEYQKAQAQYDGIKAQIEGVLQSVQDGMTAAGEKAFAQFNTVSSVVGQQVRQDHGISRFVEGSAALYVRPGSGYDVTDEVIKRVNAKLPDIRVEFPARKQPPATEPATPAKKK